MASEFVQFEPRLKEILYRCVEHIRATKGALYVAKPNGSFELVTHYGFGDALRKQLGANDVVIDRLLMRRAAFFVNGLNVEPRFSDLLFASQTDRILVAPIYSRGKLLGFIDLRDKAGRQPFEPPDLDEAKKIADQFVEFFAQRGLLGADSAAATAAETPLDVSTPVGRIIELARAGVARDVTRIRPVSGMLTEGDLTAVRDVLPAILVIPGATVAAFSAFGHSGNVQLIAARSVLADEALGHFQAKLNSWLRSRGGEIDFETRNHMIYPFGSSGAPLNQAQLSSILSAPVNVSGMKGLVLSVAFESAPEASARKHLERFLEIVQHTVEYSGAMKTLRLIRQKTAEKLLEPDFQKFPELVEHSRKTSDLADQFAHSLGLSAGECETIRIAGLLHDVGMRLLDYARLYRKQNITPDDMKILREHPAVGAVLVEPIFGSEIANIVYTHHERADGRGYPAGIAGENIPLASRVIQICEAFDAMTSPHSYQAQMSEEAALKQVLRMGGAEFDHSLAIKFKELIGH